MQRRKSGWTLRIITLAAFWLGAIVSWWKVVEKGPEPAILIPAVCFTIGAVILLARAIRFAGARSAADEQRGSGNGRHD